jgi:hypothetical protein
LQPHDGDGTLANRHVDCRAASGGSLNLPVQPIKGGAVSALFDSELFPLVKSNKCAVKPLAVRNFAFS